MIYEDVKSGRRVIAENKKLAQKLLGCTTNHAKYYVSCIVEGGGVYD